MDCPVCDNQVFRIIQWYTKPDKYERYVGIEDVNRCWAKCSACGFIVSRRNYPLSDLEKIYKSGYRDTSFRGETIKSSYSRIMALGSESENFKRVSWLVDNADFNTAIDIGSGLGVFPSELKSRGKDVECTEENNDSIWFIATELGIRCFNKLPRKKYDLVSTVHVLEHIEDTGDFLRAAKNLSKKFIFVEVPDAEEFNYLPPSHDEFNSCHVVFYDVSSLYRVLTKNGLNVTNIKRVYHKDRKLSRIMAICQLTGK